MPATPSHGQSFGDSEHRDSDFHCPPAAGVPTESISLRLCTVAVLNMELPARAEGAL